MALYVMMAAPTPMKQLAMNLAMCVLLLSVSSSCGRDWSVKMKGPPLCGACKGTPSISLILFYGEHCKPV